MFPWLKEKDGLLFRVRGDARYRFCASEEITLAGAVNKDWPEWPWLQKEGEGADWKISGRVKDSDTQALLISGSEWYLFFKDDLTVIGRGPDATVPDGVASELPPDYTPPK
jgi:hypothetical protein